MILQLGQPRHLGLQHLGRRAFGTPEQENGTRADSPAVQLTTIRQDNRETRPGPAPAARQPAGKNNPE